MKKCRIAAICLLACLLLLGGCSREKEAKKSGTYICYVNTEGTGLVEESYEITGDSVEEEIKDVLKAMQEEPDTIEYKSAFPKGVSVEKWKLEKGGLTLHFNTDYRQLDTSTEVLLRSAVVKTFVQISGVNYVEFYIKDEPLTDKEGNAFGYMRAEDFIQNTGASLHSYQVGDLNLYFANEKGTGLVEKKVSVRYNSNMSVEKLIVEQLVKGPSMKGAYPTISAETKLLGVSIKDGICYVNFNEEFLDTSYRIDPKMTIYSIVNSIVEGGETNQVQILVNGETDVVYQGQVDLSEPFFPDLSYVEEEKK